MAAFEIDGREYPVPSVFQLTMGEAQTLYDYSGYTLEDFVPPAPGSPNESEVEERRVQQLRNPSFKRAMVHIAYQRGNPDTAKADVASFVDGVNMLDMVFSMYGVDDEDPTPVSQKQQPEKNSPSEASSSEGSGRRSEPTSAEAAVTLLRTGTTG